MMPPASDLIDQITAAIDKSAEVARAATPGPWCVLNSNSIVGVEQSAVDDAHLVAEMEKCHESGHPDRRAEDAAFIAHNNPAASLRRCAVDQRILAAHPYSHLGEWKHSWPRPDWVGEDRPHMFWCTECQDDDGNPASIGEYCETILALADGYGVTANLAMSDTSPERIQGTGGGE